MRTLLEYEKLYPARTNLPSGAEVTRVAPSPTGRPHIGTALQALLDFSLADQTEGVFILRIENTDQKRIKEGVIEEIIETLNWLNLTPEEGLGIGGEYGPYLQSERLPIYQAAANWLVEHKFAYYCFCSEERLESVRQKQIAAGETPIYDGCCRRLSREEVEERLSKKQNAVIRLAIPPDTKISFNDPLRGNIEFDSNVLGDNILLKSDGFPTYHLAVVVDDHFMRVTTAIRGEEWIPSTPRHLLLYKYFGWTAPRIIHTPLLRNTDRSKLSKRTGDTAIKTFELKGYLPKAYRNFLSRIIWAHPEEKDIYSYEEFREKFVITDLSVSGPIVNYELLDFINAQYTNLLSPADFYQKAVCLFDELRELQGDITLELMTSENPNPTPIPHNELMKFVAVFTRDPEYSQNVIALCGERLKKLTDIITYTPFLYPELFVPSSKDVLARPLKSAEQAARQLNMLAENYHPADSEEEWNNKIREQGKKQGIKVGKLFMTIRMAITASKNTPPLYEITQFFGREEVLRRLKVAIQELRSETGVPSDDKS